MWGRRTSYKNQWTNKREAFILWVFVGVLFTIVVHYTTGQVSVGALRRLSTLAIMIMPSLVAGGYWLGTMETRGFTKGVQEKQVLQQQPLIIQPADYMTQLLEPNITHKQEIVDA